MNAAHIYKVRQWFLREMICLGGKFTNMDKIPKKIGQSKFRKWSQIALFDPLGSLEGSYQKKYRSGIFRLHP